jgi:hypothetical protein
MDRFTKKKESYRKLYAELSGRRYRGRCCTFTPPLFVHFTLAGETFFIVSPLSVIDA